MKYRIHIPALLEFACNVVCDDVVLRGSAFSTTRTIPYPLYLRCITTYADKYDKDRYSPYRWYRDVRAKKDVSCRMAIAYPNVLDHIVLDNSVDIEMLSNVVKSHQIDDVVGAIYRFASRCEAFRKHNLLVKFSSMALKHHPNRSIRDTLIYFGGALDPNDVFYFNHACGNGMSDVVKQLIEMNHQSISADLLRDAIVSGDCETITLVKNAADDDINIYFREVDLRHVTVDTLECVRSLNLLKRRTHYNWHNIPSFAVLQWILDHDVMDNDRIVTDVAKSAACYSGHYTEMLHWLLEEKQLTMPDNVLGRMYITVNDLLVYDYLLFHGAKVNCGRTGTCVMQFQPLLIRYYIDNGLNKSSIDTMPMGQCLENCTKRGMSVQVLDMTIDKYKINVNHCQSTGIAPIFDACRNNDYDMVEMLLRRGAHAWMVDDYGRTPYQETQNRRIRELLEKN